MIEKTDSKIDFQSISKFIKDHYLKNRTIVSKDISGIFNDIEQLAGLPIVRHKYHTGDDHGTWIVPHQWDVNEAWLKNSEGEVIASYDDHPLFVSPYSKPVRLTLNTEELLKHTISEPLQPDAYAFNWRYASDARLRLKDWGISLPQNTIDGLGVGPFELFIDAEISEGDMLVGEMTIPGESEDTILFIADYCHPGQVNDSFSGLAMFAQVMRLLAQRKKSFYTYKLLIVHETIGSAIYIASEPERIRHVKGALFSEMVAWGKEWFLKYSRNGDTYMDLLARECCRTFTNMKTSEFYSLIGNDEYIFDSIQVGIPTLSLLKYPFNEYHTSNDRPALMVEEDMQQAVDVVLHMVDVLEKDAVYEHSVPVPFWMTRYDLYSDDQYEQEDFLVNLHIVYRYLDGKKSVLEIADLVGVPFEHVYKYIEKMRQNGLVSFKQEHSSHLMVKER